MPEYTMKNNKTGEVKTVILTLSEREEFLKDPDWTQCLATPGIVSGVGGVLSKTDDGWKDVLKSVKKASGKSNTINV